MGGAADEASGQYRRAVAALFAAHGLNGLPLFSVMLVAAVSVHVKHGFFMTGGGYEYTLVLGVAGLTIAFTGPGALSLDALFGLTMSGGLSGVTAFVVGLVGGVIQLARRRPAPSLQTVHAE